jgi:hypothetical protein
MKENAMNLTVEQQYSLDRGEAVPVTIAGRSCVLLTQEMYERVRESVYDCSPWTDEEMDLLAAEDADGLGWQGMEVYQDEQDNL